MQFKINYDEILNEVNEPSDKNENTEISYEDLIDEIVEEKLLNTFARKMNVNNHSDVSSFIFKISSKVPSNVREIYDEWKYVYRRLMTLGPEHRKQSMLINNQFHNTINEIDEYTRKISDKEKPSHYEINQLISKLDALMGTIKGPLWKGGSTQGVSAQLNSLMKKLHKIYKLTTGKRMH